MQAVLYTSNTGSTAQYAKYFAQATGLPVYPAAEAKKMVPVGTEIIYFGWLMASSVKGYQKIAGRYRIGAVCAVGMCETGTQKELVRKKNAIPQSIPLFTLQGNFRLESLHGFYRILMSLMVKSAKKALEEKKNRTPEEEDFLRMLIHGENAAHMENLTAMLTWYREREGKENA